MNSQGPWRLLKKTAALVIAFLTAFGGAMEGQTNVGGLLLTQELSSNPISINSNLVWTLTLNNADSQARTIVRLSVSIPDQATVTSNICEAAISSHAHWQRNQTALASYPFSGISPP